MTYSHVSGQEPSTKSAFCLSPDSVPNMLSASLGEYASAWSPGIRMMHAVAESAEHPSPGARTRCPSLLTRRTLAQRPAGGAGSWNPECWTHPHSAPGSAQPMTSSPNSVALIHVP